MVLLTERERGEKAKGERGKAKGKRRKGKGEREKGSLRLLSGIDPGG
jgi:hypothetical protein